MLRRVKRKFGSSAPKLAVRPHVPWYVRWAIVLPFVLAAGGLVWWAYDIGLEFAGFHRGQAEHELSELRDQIAALRSENAKLSSEAAFHERQAQIEHAANQETLRQLKVLGEENAKINEDLAFFQNLTVSGVREGDLSIHRFKIERDSLPGEYHCRLLIVRNVQQRAKDFQGNLQLLVNVRQNGKRSVVSFPPEGQMKDEAFQLNFKYYQRVERSFQLPPGVLVESIQARVFERGEPEPKIKQSVNLS